MTARTLRPTAATMPAGFVLGVVIAHIRLRSFAAATSQVNPPANL